MTEFDKILDAAARNAEAAARLQTAADRLAPAVSNGGNVTFAVNAGGIGVWVAVACCAVMLALNIGMAVLLVRQDREISEMGHQLNAIYMMAPHLKPEVTP